MGPAPRFLFGSDFKKKSGPDISARPAYIRGANDRIRTGDLRFTRALLYQLSHVGTGFLRSANMNYTEEPVVSQGANATFRANERAFAVSPQACILALRPSRAAWAHVPSLLPRRPRAALARLIAAASLPKSRPMRSVAAYSSFSGPSPPAREPGPLAARSCSRCPACRAERPDRGCP